MKVLLMYPAMDSKQQLSNLDPKLKETYDRVMGTTFTPPVAAAPQATPPPPPAMTPPQQMTPPPMQPQPSVMQQTPQPVMQTVSVSTPDNSTRGFVASEEGDKGGGISPFILVLAGIVFFAVYVVFWIKIFNVPIGLPI